MELLELCQRASVSRGVIGRLSTEEKNAVLHTAADLVLYNEESILAAKTALDGSSYVGNSLYFLNPTIAESTWIIQNRQYYTTISKHDFYA